MIRTRQVTKRRVLPAPGKPVFVLREETERPEAVEAGGAKIIGTESERIVAEAELLLNDAEQYARISRRVSPYGDGRAAERIAKILSEQLASDTKLQ